LTPPPRARGFTLLELVVVICIVAVLSARLLASLVYYQEQAEKVAMESTLGAMQTGLAMQVSALLLRGTPEDINGLAEQNPMEWLAERPGTYIGSFLHEPPPAAGTGIWFFDSATRTLVYRPQRRRHLVPGPDGSYDLRFRADARFAPEPAGSRSGAIPALQRLRIGAVREYRWFRDEP
jgi:prepilin-type N-terminal cleavage/methylation domain-containing protein